MAKRDIISVDVQDITYGDTITWRAFDRYQSGRMVSHTLDDQGRPAYRVTLPSNFGTIATRSRVVSAFRYADAK